MLNKKQIVARIASHSKSAKKLREEIQVTLCEIAGHVVQHGEVSLYQALLNSVQGVNRVGIHAWIAENGGARVKDEGILEKFGVSLEDAQSMIMTARIQLGWVDPSELAEEPEESEEEVEE